MRVSRIVVLLVALALPLVLASSAGALDICAEPVCQPPPAEQNTPYEFEFEAEEGCVPYRFSFLNGTLPAGLAVTADGKLAGTPTQAGTFEFWVGLDDNSGPDNPFCRVPSTQSQGQFFITVLPDLAVVTDSLPIATPGTPYSAQLQFSSPEAGWQVIWDITSGALPPGLSLSASGLISGTPTASTVARFTVRAREPFRRWGERALTLTVATALQATAAARPGEVGVRYAGAVRTTGGIAPVTWAVTSGTLPRGLELVPATGEIVGTPRAAGTFPVTFEARDAGARTATVAATIRIAARLAVATTRLPRASANTRYRARIAAAGGVAPRRWSIVRGSLPRGLVLHGRTGLVSGAPRRTGVFPITVEVRDGLGARARRALRIVVRG